ncbi:MarR family transcriptional regulator [Aurantiacibacter xanthus]|uniref:MarR family transcriptional regulator n=2 Tax=Aurantiacibacter xanthus TaxID=1784712 RepID=A0A3A1P9S8_9SPHN|nr:MarR family transcriptional regulator [Aurantiacibacter xanthus]
MALLAKMMDRLTIRQLADEFGLTYAQWRVIARLGELRDGATVGRIAEQALADRAEVSRAVSWLAEQQLLSRTEDPSDRRAQVLRLTAKGRKLYSKVIRTRTAFHQSITAALSAEEIAQFDGLIDKIRLTLQAKVDAL